MRIKVRTVGVALAAAVGILAFSAGSAQATTNSHNTALLNTGDVNALNTSLCNSPVNGVVGITADVVSPRTTQNCVNAGGQVGGTTGEANTHNNAMLLNAGNINAGNTQLCNSPVNLGIAATAQAGSPNQVANCANSGASVAATDLGQVKNVDNYAGVLNTSDVNAVDTQLCNSPANAVIGLDVPVVSPNVADACANAGSKIVGSQGVTAGQHYGKKKARSHSVRHQKRMATKVTSVKVKASKTTAGKKH